MVAQKIRNLARHTVWYWTSCSALSHPSPAKTPDIVTFSTATDNSCTQVDFLNSSNLGYLTGSINAYTLPNSRYSERLNQLSHDLSGKDLLGMTEYDQAAGALFPDSVYVLPSLDINASVHQCFTFGQGLILKGYFSVGKHRL